MLYPSLGDIIQVADAVYAIYRFWSDAPEGVKRLFEDVQNVAERLRFVDKVLSLSGWPRYKFAGELKTFLNETQQYLEQYRKFATGSLGEDSRLKQTSARIRQTFRLGFDNDRVTQIRTDLEDHLQKIRDFERDVTFFCTIRQLRNTTSELCMRETASRTSSIRTSDKPESSARPQRLLAPLHRVEDDNASIFSQATEAYELAFKLKTSAVKRFRNSLEPIPSESPSLGKATLTPDQAFDNDLQDFITDALTTSKNNQLYSNPQSSATNLRDLVRISGKARELMERAQHGGVESIRHISAPELPSISSSPESFAESFWNSVPYETDNSSIFSRLRPSCPNSTGLDGTVPSRADGEEEITSIHSRSSESNFAVGPPAVQNLRRTGWAAMLIPGETDRLPLTGEIAVTEGLVGVWAISTSPAHRSSVVSQPSLPLSPVALSPKGWLKRPQSVSSTQISNPDIPETFQHLFPSSERPFPSVLHPSVEGPLEKSAPYSFSFRKRQRVIREGASKEHWVDGLSYAFQNRADRDLFRAEIFGKTLLVSAGAKEISSNPNVFSSSQSEVSLWNDARKQIKTITFTQHLRQGKQTFLVDAEYQVLGLVNAANTKNPRSSTLGLVVKLHRDISNAPPEGSTSSQGRISSQLSTGSKKNKKILSRGLEPADVICMIDFTEKKGDGIGELNRKRFMGHLREYAVA